jgi:hypothetical protein
MAAARYFRRAAGRDAAFAWQAYGCIVVDLRVLGINEAAPRLSLLLLDLLIADWRLRWVSPRPLPAMALMWQRRVRSVAVTLIPFTLYQARLRVFSALAEPYPGVIRWLFPEVGAVDSAKFPKSWSRRNNGATRGSGDGQWPSATKDAGSPIATRHSRVAPCVFVTMGILPATSAMSQRRVGQRRASAGPSIGPENARHRARPARAVHRYIRPARMRRHGACI